MAKPILDRVVAALEGLRHGKGGCFCDKSFIATHSPACVAASKALAAHAAGPKRQATRAVLESFESFRAAYPRPTGMSKAREVWIALAPAPGLVDQILAKIALFKRTTWFGREQALIPHATTFLRQQRWEDAPEAPATSGRRLDPGLLPPPTAAPREYLREHVFKLLGALERPRLVGLIGSDTAPLVIAALKALPVERALAEVKLAKIEARLLTLVVAGLSDDDLATCRKATQDILGPKNSLMAADAWEQAKVRAFELAVYQHTGLPVAF